MSDGKRPGNKPFGQRSAGGRAPSGAGRPPMGRPAGGRPMGSAPTGGRPPMGNGRGPDAGRRPQGAMAERRAPAPVPSVSMTARRVALDTLLDVTVQDAYASLALDKRLSGGAMRLSDRDRALCTQLVYGVLENRIRIDYMIDQFLENPQIDKVVREILRLGAYQLFFLDRVPDMAAVNESVALTRGMGMEALTGLVNAVLRNMIRKKDDIRFPKTEEGACKYISVMFSMPEMIVQRLIDAYGERTALEIARYRPTANYTTLRVSQGRMTVADLEAFLKKQDVAFEKSIMDGMLRVIRGGDLSSTYAFRNGLFSIQGESSVLAARSVGVRPGMTVLDACAAPGGKTAVLSEQMEGTGRVYAWDKHEHRVALIRAMAQRLGLDNVRPVTRDATVLREESIGLMDAVLVDAPCSGTGVMLEKPDLKYRQSDESIGELVQTQREILDTCCQYVKPGGILTYATCSILPEENTMQIQAFLERHPEFSLAGLRDNIPEALHAQVKDGMLQLLPHRDGLEGFFIARMIKQRG